MKLTRKIQEKYEPEAKCNLQSNQRFETGMKSNSSGFVFPFKLFPRELTAEWWNNNCTLFYTVGVEWKLFKTTATIHSHFFSNMERAEACNRCSPHLADFLVQDTGVLQMGLDFPPPLEFPQILPHRWLLPQQGNFVFTSSWDLEQKQGMLSPSIQNKPLCELYVGLRKHKVAACFSLPLYIPSSSPPIFYTQKYLNL